MKREYKGSYRSIYTRLYDDKGFQRLRPRERDVLKTLRTCPATNFPVLYRFTWEELAVWTGYTISALKTSVTLLEREGWVVCHYPCIWVKNGLKFDPNFARDNSDHVTGVQKALLDVPSPELIEMFLDYYSLPRGVLPPPQCGSEHPHKDRERERDREKGDGKGITDLRDPPLEPDTLRADFETFWKAYPKSKGVKGVVFDRYKTARKSASAEEILRGTTNYAKECELVNDGKGIDPHFIKWPERWLKEKRWLAYQELSEEAATDAKLEAILGSFNP